MSQVDQFESVFRSAVKDPFRYEAVRIQSVLLATDLETQAADEFSTKVRKFLQVIHQEHEISWNLLTGDDYSSTEDLLASAEQAKPDLICAYRNLHSRAWQYPHSLGSQLDVLLQKTTTPVLILPHPRAGYAFEHALQDTNRVLAVTDHLTEDHRLVNHAVAFTEAKGTLFLTHIEDQQTFDRYLAVISKISTIDTDDARERLQHQLLKEPADYIASCQGKLEEAGIAVRIESTVEFGKHLAQYKRHIQEHDVDLLVMNTRDEDQLAMHGLAYPLAVEIRQIPLLML